MVTQLAVGGYRQTFLEELEAQSSEGAISLLVICGKDYFDRSTVTRVFSKLVEISDRNVFLFGRRVAFQRRVIRRAVGADVCVLEFNPRILSNWVILAGRSGRKRPTILWGHAWSRSGPRSRTERIRRTMRRMADEVLVYTEQDAAGLLANSPSHRVGVVPNSLSRERDIVPANGSRRDVLFVGRLVAPKKPDLLLRAFAEAVRERPGIRSLQLAGDGPESGALRAEATRLSVGNRVKFHGWVSSHAELEALYGDSFCAVSPGYVGLSATQAAGFGIPLVYTRDEPHAPEVALLHEGNSRVVASDSPDELAQAIIDMYDRCATWQARAEMISQEIRRQYSAEVMAAAFLAAVDRSVS